MNTIFRVRSMITAASALLSIAPTLFAAEPTVDSKDLPRIPATEPDTVLSTFRIKPGFHIELVAAEPHVMSPVALSFDENGRMFVVEMRDYSERRDEQLGRVRLLEDTDGDGRFDKSTVFTENLPWPTAVICYNGGVFVGATPDIYFFKDTNGDGVADVKEVTFTGFGTEVNRLNVQQLLNSFTWGLDNRIHGATAGNGGRITSPKNPTAAPVDLRGRDFSFDPRTLEMRAESGGGQHGMSFDDRGRKFVCSNSAHLQMVMFEERYAARNPLCSMPSPLMNIAMDGPAAEVFRISPDEPWRVIRTRWRVSGLVPGPIEGGGRASGYFTGATGVMIYRGDAWSEEYRGSAFVADCGSNLIHRKKLFPDGVALQGRRPDDELKTEFLASTDNWFRPVQFANAPDGNLYVIDIYREVIEHPWSLPEPIKKHLDLNSGNNRGRIYRIVPENFKQRKLPQLGSASSADLIATLEHPNGWHRDTAARLIYERRNSFGEETGLGGAKTPLGRLHELYVFDGLGQLSSERLERALISRDAGVRQHALRLSERLLADAANFPSALWLKIQRMVLDPDPGVRYQLAFLLGSFQHEGRVALLGYLARRDLEDRWMRAAVLNSVRDDADDLFADLVKPATGIGLNAILETPAGQDLLERLVLMIAAGPKLAETSTVLNVIPTLSTQTLQFRLASALLDGLARLSFSPRVLTFQNEKALKDVRQTAADSLRNRSASDPERIAAAQLLGRGSFTGGGESLVAVLNPNEPQDLQVAAVSALGQIPDPEAASALLQRWESLTPRMRSTALASILARSIKIPALLDAIEQNIVKASELSSQQSNLLRSYREPSVRQRAQRLLIANPSRDREAIVQSFMPALKLPGDAAHGRKVFVERCASCHRHGGEGQAVGPDLASAQSGGKEKLLTGIIDPSREVPPQFVNYSIETTDSETIMGLIASENTSTVTLRRAFGDETVVPRSRIRKIQSSNQSVMPEGLETSFSQQDMADLLEFIVSSGQR